MVLMHLSTLDYCKQRMAVVCMQIVEGETRLKQQQNLYEAVRADRNLYSKNLIQAQDEIQEMKRKFQIMVSIRFHMQWQPSACHAKNTASRYPGIPPVLMGGCVQ